MHTQLSDVQKETRNLLLNLRITPSERKMFAEVATHEQRTLSQVIREALAEKAAAAKRS